MAGTSKAKGGPGGDSFVLWVRARPRSRTDEVLGWAKDGFLEVQIRAVPERGEANRSCRSQLARLLGIPPSQISLEKGKGSVHKKYRIYGLSREDGERILAQALGKKV
jgi:uncharacterized protein YggU (UPF0235/DUF167 family)